MEDISRINAPFYDKLVYSPDDGGWYWERFNTETKEEFTSQIFSTKEEARRATNPELYTCPVAAIVWEAR